MEPWCITEEKVQAAIQKIVEVSKPLSIVLFGSYVRGQVGPNSDLDILVVVNENVKNCRQESVRIRRALKGISMPMDILVIPHHKLKRLKHVPGLIYATALREGKIVYEKAA
jgi:predicted nucleotidyltransferase